MPAGRRKRRENWSHIKETLTAHPENIRRGVGVAQGDTLGLVGVNSQYPAQEIIDDKGAKALILYTELRSLGSEGPPCGTGQKGERRNNRSERYHGGTRKACSRPSFNSQKTQPLSQSR